LKKYTDKQLITYWMARCPECGWKGLSCDCNGFSAIADTGDYDDGYCPKCNSTIDSIEDVSKKYLLWLFRHITFWNYRKRYFEKLNKEKYIKNMEEDIDDNEPYMEVYQFGMGDSCPDWFMNNLTSNSIITRDPVDSSPFLKISNTKFAEVKTTMKGTIIAHQGDYISYTKISDTNYLLDVFTFKDMDELVTKWHNDRHTKLTLQQYLGMNDIQFQRFIVEG